MSQHDDIETPNTFESDASLRMALRGLPREIEPANDLWPGIAARIQAAPAQTSVRKPARRPWAWPVAMAASLLVATGLAWQVRPSHPQAVAAATPAEAAGGSLVQREADSLTLQYQAAMRELDGRPMPATWQPGLQALDQSALEIREALLEHPESRLLLERLRTTYTRRIAISRRALHA